MHWMAGTTSTPTPVPCYVAYQQHVVKSLHDKEPHFTQSNM